MNLIKTGGGILLLCLLSLRTYSFADSPVLVLATINAPNTRIYKISEAVLGEALKQNGFGLILKTYPPKRAALMADAGQIDGDAHRIYDFNKENRFSDLIRVSEPLQSVDQSVFSRIGDIRIAGWKSLAPHRVIYVTGVKLVEDGLRSAVPESNLLPANSVESAFKMLSANRGELTIASTETGFAALKKLSLQNSGIQVLTPPVVITDLYTYLHKKHLDLAEKLADTLKKMKADGSYQKIIESIN